jgi:hypothetical protein
VSANRPLRPTTRNENPGSAAPDREAVLGRSRDSSNSALQLERTRCLVVSVASCPPGPGTARSVRRVSTPCSSGCARTAVATLWPGRSDRRRCWSNTRPPPSAYANRLTSCSTRNGWRRGILTGPRWRARRSAQGRQAVEGRFGLGHKTTDQLTGGDEFGDAAHALTGGVALLVHIDTVGIGVAAQVHHP